MKLVPSKSTGMARRAYNRAYTQSASGKTNSTLGKLKLRSDPVKPSKVDTKTGKAKSMQRRDYGVPPDNFASFGTTGFTDEEFNL